MKLLRSINVLTCSLTLLLLTSVASFADVVTGTFNIAGTAVVGVDAISFVCTPGIAATPCPTNTSTTPTSTEGDFFTVPPVGPDPGLPPALSGGYITELTAATTPVGAPFTPVLNWLTVGDVALDLTANLAGVSPQAPAGTGVCGGVGFAGETCTPVIGGNVSNFNLQNTATGFTASFSVMGIARDLDGGPNNVSDFTGNFSAEVDGITYQQALNNILTLGPQTFSYSASFNLTPAVGAPVPEPGFLPFFTGVAVLIGFVTLSRKLRHQ